MLALRYVMCSLSTYSRDHRISITETCRLSIAHHCLRVLVDRPGLRDLCPADLFSRLTAVAPTPLPESERFRCASFRRQASRYRSLRCANVSASRSSMSTCSPTSCSTSAKNLELTFHGTRNG